jgi:hypothetical protein
MSVSSVKVSELSSFNITDDNINFSHILVYDTTNNEQSVNGSVITSPLSSLSNQFWSQSASNLTSLRSTVNTNSATTWNYQGTDVKTLTSSWQTTYTVVNTNSATWASPDGTKLPLSGGIVTGPIDISSGTITNIPLSQMILSANYTAVLSDAGKHYYHPITDNNARTFTIPSNASVAYPLGTTLTIVNDINTVTISINADTLVLAGGSSTGSRSLTSTGMATAMKVTSTRWVIGGMGIS